LFNLFMRNGESLGAVARAKGVWRSVNRLAHLLRRNSKARARANIAFHYDLGNDFYRAWLDPGMTYSSAMFAAGDTLQEAQERKIHALLDRLELKPGQRLLEIGCGWGSLAEIAARDYGVQVVGLTLSAEQKQWADNRIARAGLSERVSVELIDYRDLDGSFDAVASVEMVEAVGQDYWAIYLQTIARVLRPGGRAALQLISIREELFDAYAASADFIQTYVFPGGMLISEPRFQALAELAGLSWRDRAGFGQDYAETLKLWRERYDEAVAEGRLPSGFDERFHDLWRYYLMYCEGGFRGRGIDVAQVTLVKTS
jgi:cyclopropane-fatty-acyl-phospholipid synthase